MEGVVKSFNSIKGYGFIKVKGVKEDIYVHFSSIIDQPLGKKNLALGELVKLDVISTEKGLCAKNVCSRAIRK